MSKEIVEWIGASFASGFLIFVVYGVVYALLQVAYYFKKGEMVRSLKFDMRFCPFVQAGIKNESIRRDTDLVVGEKILLEGILPKFGGDEEFIPLKEVEVSAIYQITMDCDAKSIRIMDRGLSPADIDFLFTSTGWESTEEAWRYYEGMYGALFTGVIIRWK